MVNIDLEWPLEGILMEIYEVCIIGNLKKSNYFSLDHSLYKNGTCFYMFTGLDFYYVIVEWMNSLLPW
jgi:hypothetical protein